MTKLEHMLVHLMEECAEVQHAASKLLRFGHSPLKHANLQDEVNDLRAAITLVEDAGNHLWYDEEKIMAKRYKVEEYWKETQEQSP